MRTLNKLASRRPDLQPLAVAAAAALTLVSAGPAQAQYFSYSESVSTTPTDLFPIDGSLQTQDLSGSNLLVGSGAIGSFAAQSGAQLKAAQLAIGNSGTGSGSVTLSGTENRVAIGFFAASGVALATGALLLYLNRPIAERLGYSASPFVDARTGTAGIAAAAAF